MGRWRGWWAWGNGSQSVEAREEEGTQALRIARRFTCGTISPSIKPDSKSARAVKKLVCVELDR
jgi:hypothetical protein